MKNAPPPTPDTVKLNVLLYGRPKTGKTSGACTLSRFGGVRLFNCGIPDETRYARSRRNDPEGRIQEPEIPAYSIDASGQPVRHVQNLMREIMLEAYDASADPDPDPLIGTVVVDPLGELYRRLLIEESARAKDPSWDHRRAVVTYIEEFCQFLFELPKIHVVVVCHEMQVESDDGVLFRPNAGSKAQSLSGLSPKIEGWANVIAYTGMKALDDGTKRPWAQLFPAGGRVGGDRFGGCLGDERALDLAEWLEVIRAYEEGRPVPQPEGPGSNVDTPAPDPSPSTSQARNGSSGSTPPPGETEPSEPRRRSRAKAKA